MAGGFHPNLLGYLSFAIYATVTLEGGLPGEARTEPDKELVNDGRAGVLWQRRNGDTTQRIRTEDGHQDDVGEARPRRV